MVCKPGISYLPLKNALPYLSKILNFKFTTKLGVFAQVVIFYFPHKVCQDAPQIYSLDRGSSQKVRIHVTIVNKLHKIE
jgi:hypothetical protein